MKTEYLNQIPDSWAETAEIFTALGDSHRQRILLLFEPNEQLTISQIVAVFPLSRTAMTHHLNVLRDAKLLTSEKIGKEVFLKVNTELLLHTFSLLGGFVQNLHSQERNQDE